MKRFSRKQQEQAKAFILECGRPLEQQRYVYRFEGGGTTGVLQELARYQNEDGGFGKALEPDLRVWASSAIATACARQVARELDLPEDNRLVRGAMDYLRRSYDLDTQTWMNVPPSVDSAPHAPWWTYHGDPSKVLANPRVEIAGYFLDYPGCAPPAPLDTLVEIVLTLDALTVLRNHGRLE